MTAVMLVAMFVVIALGLTTALIVSGQRARRREHQRKGLRYLQLLRSLVSLVQQHRGLSNGFLSGGKELVYRIETLQKNIETEWQRLVNEAAGAELPERFHASRDHWHRLRSRYAELEVENNLRQHGTLIQNLLYLIDDVARESDLLLLRVDDGKPLVYAWRDLLTAAECVGQARALGTGVLASGRCDAVARIRLKYLCEKVEKTTSIAWQKLPPGAEQLQALDTLLKCVDDSLLSEKYRVSVADYFRIATDAIDSLYRQYDSILARVTP